MKIGNAIRWTIAIALIVLSFANASWLAPQPKGSLRLIAESRQPGCQDVEVTRADIMAGADVVTIDAIPLEGCTPPTVPLRELARYSMIFEVENAAATLAIFEQIKRPIDQRYGFIGHDAAISEIRRKHPNAWAFTIAEARKCFSDYIWQGWLTVTPSSCKNGTMVIPIDQKWKVAGWPRRFQARMAAAGTRVILAGEGTEPDHISGLGKLEEIAEIPRDYTGYVWVSNIELIGRSIRR